jgi:hypothetical protein
MSYNAEEQINSDQVVLGERAYLRSHMFALDTHQCYLLYADIAIHKS